MLLRSQQDKYREATDAISPLSHRYGYGLFHLLDQNSKLKEVEWLYRRERTLYRTEKDLHLLINNEKEFITGTTHEQDSLKQLIRYWEQKGGHDKTFLYFNPTED